MKCVCCNGMKTFINDLQEEVRRLKGVTDDLQKQISDAGAVPEIPAHLRDPKQAKRGTGGNGFQNICPACKLF